MFYKKTRRKRNGGMSRMQSLQPALPRPGYTETGRSCRTKNALSPRQVKTRKARIGLAWTCCLYTRESRDHNQMLLPSKPKGHRKESSVAPFGNSRHHDLLRAGVQHIDPSHQVGTWVHSGAQQSPQGVKSDGRSTGEMSAWCRWRACTGMSLQNFFCTPLQNSRNAAQQQEASATGSSQPKHA